MGLKDIVGNLDWLLDAEKGRAAKQVDAIEVLLAKLVLKEAKYNEKLGHVKTERERKKLERKIKVSRAQIAKGRAAVEELRLETQ